MIRFARLLAALILPLVAPLWAQSPAAPAPRETAQPIPFRPSEGLDVVLVKTAGALLVALAAGGVAAGVWMRHRARNPPAAPRRLQVRERVRLNGRSMLYLVEVDGKTVLVGQCGDRLWPLTSHVPAASPGDPVTPGSIDGH